jgi:PhnB protein
MSQVKTPEGHQTVIPYLMLESASKFIEFTTAVFQAEVTQKHYQEDEPERIKHAEVKIGDSTIMFTDGNADWPAQPGSLFIYVADADEIYKKALAAGGKSIMEPADQDYGRSCGVSDPCNNSWWITSVA